MKHIATVAVSTPEFTRKGEGDVAELPDGRLLLVYMEFSGEGSDEATTRFAAVESDDGGLTWSGHRVVAETAPGDVNIYSPNLACLPDGTVLLLFMRQHARTPRSSTQHVWASRDGGRTFAPWSVFAPRQPFSLCNGVLKRLATGRLVVPLSIGGTGGGVCPGYGGTTMLSDDHGRTWREAQNRLELPMRGIMEPHVAETTPGDPGRLLMAMRTQLGSVFVSESRDAGETWSKPRSTGLPTPESCPELATVPSTGDLLLIWNPSPYDPGFASHFGKRSPLSAAVSRDGGRTWGEPRAIENDPGRAFSNPGCRFTRDGRAIINYWTCEYLPSWYMQDVIDLRVAAIDTEWFYGG